MAKKYLNPNYKELLAARFRAEYIASRDRAILKRREAEARQRIRESRKLNSSGNQ